MITMEINCEKWCKDYEKRGKKMCEQCCPDIDDERIDLWNALMEARYTPSKTLWAILEEYEAISKCQSPKVGDSKT